ncbi:MAG: hypothetical protein IPH18_06250 [Chitinophagaceae bacterium]|nr:hypothetical protein [Chitinophagaceae bacterium]MBK8951225.1 hypothetical protein [Chitinophagaceae bacterium]
MLKFVKTLVMAGLILLAFTAAYGQSASKAIRPYKISNYGRQFIVKSTKNIQHIMIWTTDGHRVVEQKDINSKEAKVEIPVYRKAYFILIYMADGKSYSEKIGVNTN